MTAVDEHETERHAPVRGHGRRATDDRDHDVLETRVLDRATEARQRVHAPGARVDELLVVVLPAGLVLLGAAVVVDGEQHGAALTCGGTEVHRRLPAVRPDLEQRSDGGTFEPRRVQREPLVVGHEADRATRVIEQRRVHRLRPST